MSKFPQTSAKNDAVKTTTRPTLTHTRPVHTLVKPSESNHR